ncbi:MAG: hypothetical protein EPO40_14600 [Myxococcaceae bacterium]|nr:MAG: hypothetical protein EPO40_14600 [Myxococcaceae bacterium]
MNNHPTATLLSRVLNLHQSREVLPSGRSVTVIADDHGERVEVRALHGTLELTIELTPTGAKLHLDAVDIALRASGTVSAECDRFEVRARSEARVSAPATTVESTEGDLTLTAHDDVRARGERVLLNCDRDDEVPDWMRSAVDARLPPR